MIARDRVCTALLAVWILTTGTTLAQPQAPTPPPVSPEVHADGRVTFRFRAPNAKEVFVARAGAERLAMTRNAAGIWEATTDVLPPDIYQYSFVADGVPALDPLNTYVSPNLLNMSNMVHVPPRSPAEAAPWDVADVPRGQLHRHFYKSARVGDHRDYFVYTPPGYDPRATTTYPVLYLLHGFSDDASGWTSVGQAHVILDNLIAQKKAVPMIVVMTLGYGAPEIVTRGPRPEGSWQRNIDGYRDALFTEVMPAIERDYRVDTARDRRAIAGLSMGGAESLVVGLNALDRFGWIGAFSSGGIPSDFGATFPSLTEANGNTLKLLYISCGTEDRLIDLNRQFRAFLTSRKIQHEAVEMPGAHTWTVWRRNLAAFLPKLFQ